VNIKSLPNTVPVPGHWSQKRKYLQGKRGIEKPPFLLPSFIRDTGVTEQRDATASRDADKSLQTKTREKLQPRMGKLNLDYEKMHDAFFKYQTKPPRMTKFGDLYYEGKEYETKVFHKKPGFLSEELRDALGMTSKLAPPPWLINMQRVGPPPSYPWLKIPGLSAPIPEGASWGYQPGGWGKAPVDEFNRPLYGDVFSTAPQVDLAQQLLQNIDRTLWGESMIEDVQDAGQLIPAEPAENSEQDSSNNSDSE
jgi:splicing factor 3B subunit 2